MYKKILKARQNWLDKRNKRKEERVHSSQTLKMCQMCYSFKYNGSWHFEEPTFISEKEGEEKEVPVKFTKCPACIEELLSQYDAEYA